MTVEQDEDGWWAAHAQLGPNVGANGQGQTRKEALDDLREAVRASFEADGGIPEWLVHFDLLAVGGGEGAWFPPCRACRACVLSAPWRMPALRWCASAEATTSYVTRMVAAPLVPVHRTRRCESVHCAGSCVTAD